ncbi:MAG: protein kinase [Myxococcota bacterium]|nr:protein kinase [Myxococcota bacterium]MEC8424650.1 protein kinase [Myxococcota bacterium]
MIGSVLDKYEVLQKIGEGGMATVYRGRHSTLGRDVAIKVLHPHLSRSERNRRRFAREARAIENLDHDNILRIFDYSGTDAEDCYIVTEFVDGETLQTLVGEHGRVPSEVAAIIGARLAEALGYAHALGIIHRDLKPENVMLRRDGAVKLMDFGIARFLDEVNLTVTGALVGSPAYMSPEQAMEKVLDKRSDLFSLGTLLFHLVTGQLPFSGSNPSIILRNIIEGNRPEVTELAPDISGALAETIERLMQTDPDDRLSSSEDARDALLQSVTETGIEPSMPHWDLRAWLEDPRGYQARLDSHLSTALMERGRGRLDSGDHLGALQLFNRLLCIDEDNKEVLELVQGMHSLGAPQERRPLRVAGALGGMAAAAVLTFALWPSVPAPAPAPSITSEPLQFSETPVQPEESTIAPEMAASPAPASTPAPVALKVAKTSKTPARIQPVRPTAPTARVEVRAPPIPDTGTLLVAVQGGAWADIVIDGEKQGRTGGGAINVTPGKHTLELRNPLAMPHRQSFEIAAGERREVVVDGLTPKMVVQFASDLADDCVVVLDGRAMGRVAALGRNMDVPEPSRAHAMELSCPEGGPRAVSLPAGAPGSVVEVTALP